ncbi:8609_t:CDS:2 [Ambispora leptoticha]|uniref:8609_t:CDS:1 n=1 Tax=Ambispora leptoticha TaxID=144679 RepID=A0A9N8ZK53_9GLOM|nr:8609_t:CDS:2 [Ambispora leptoticha]
MINHKSLAVINFRSSISSYSVTTMKRWSRSSSRLFLLASPIGLSKNQTLSARFFCQSLLLDDNNQISKDDQGPKDTENEKFKSDPKKTEITRRRFWKQVSLESNNSQGTYSILLDKRPLKTPKGSPLTIKHSQRTLALLLAGEWESQKTVLKHHSLPLTSLVSRAIDTFEDRNSSERQQAITRLLSYLDTDTVCYQQSYPESLVELQKRHWDPLLRWAQKFYEVEIKVTNSIMGVRQPESTIKRLKKVVDEFEPLKLAAFERAVMITKSYLIGLGLVERQINVKQATEAAHVEMESQTRQWGIVEDAHDVENEHVRCQLGSVACILINNS